jgi:hypothetical protein
MQIDIDWRLAVAIVALAFTIFTFWWNRRTTRKALAYEVTSVPLTSVSHDFAGRLRIVFDDQPIARVGVFHRVCTGHNAAWFPRTFRATESTIKEPLFRASAPFALSQLIGGAG